MSNQSTSHTNETSGQAESLSEDTAHFSEQDVLRSIEDLLKSEENPKKKSTSYEKITKFFKIEKRKDCDNHGDFHMKDCIIINYGEMIGSNKVVSSNAENHRDVPPSNEIHKTIESVFDESSNVSQQSFMIALAVLNEHEYNTVVEAGEELCLIIESFVNLKSKEEVIQVKRSQWVSEVLACLSDGYEVTEFGRSKIKTVAFHDATASRNLLSHVLNEYDVYFKAIFQWLLKLAEHSSLSVKLKIVEVIKQLAAHNFQIVQRELICPWAESEYPSTRMLAVLSLTLLVYDDDDEIAQQSFNLLRYWSKFANSSKLRWTAITAYGGYIGHLFPNEVSEDLKIIIESGDAKFFSNIVQALIDLFDSAEQDKQMCLSVLNILENWIEEPPNSAVHKLSLMTFWRLMREPKNSNAAVQKVPTLLLLSKEFKSIETQVSFLVNKTLDLELTRELALKEILFWLKFIDTAQEYYKTIARIMYTIVSIRSQLGRSYIFRHLQIWGKTERNKTSIQILSMLQKHLDT